MPILFVIAGPNGSGKSTLTRSGQFGPVPVIDPDAIARDLPPGAAQPVTAGREALRRRRAWLEAGAGFAVETTLAGGSALDLMRRARAAGFEVELHYVRTASARQSLDRVRQRVARGGHDVPEADLRRRFARSEANLPLAMRLADRCWLYDNSGVEVRPRIVATLSRAAVVLDPAAPGWARSAVLAWPLTPAPGAGARPGGGPSI